MTQLVDLVCPECSKRFGYPIQAGEVVATGSTFGVLCPHCETRLIVDIKAAGAQAAADAMVVEFKVVDVDGS